MAGTIESGERFGLCRLHQLRGRIGRGMHPGFCCVFAAPQTEESQERLRAFETTGDGFKLAEIDFRLRGPGELFGTRQHGLPPLRVADLQQDAELLAEARRDATAPDCRRSRPQPAAARGLAATDVGGVREGAGTGGRRARGRLLRRRPCVLVRLGRRSPHRSNWREESSRGLQTSATIGSFTMVFSLLPRSSWRGMSAAVSAGMTRPRRR